MPSCCVEKRPKRAQMGPPRDTAQTRNTYNPLWVGQKVCKYMYVNTKCEGVGINLGKGDDPIRICLVLGTPATSLSCESISVTTTFCSMLFAFAQAVGN